MSISPLKTATGMKASLVKTYNFSDVSWHNPATNRDFDKFKYLSNLCAQVGESYQMRDKSTGCWTTVEKKETLTRIMCMAYAEPVTINDQLQIITNDDIKIFINTSMMYFSGLIYAPAMGDFLIYEGQKRLNTWADHRLVGNDDHIEHAEAFLKMLRNSLCGETDVQNLDAMLEEIWSTRETPFRWAMHWLAARYQLPGFAPQTNLWFIGIRGTGKGTLMGAMGGVLGAANVGKVSKEDMARGWSDSLMNKELLEWDEFKSDKGWRDFGNTIKAVTGNDKLQTTKRAKDSRSAPAVAMHIFTTNEERPILVEKTDRQNTFIQTTMDEEVGAQSKALYDLRTGEFQPGMLSGLAALFNAIEIDLAFIRRPLKTAKRAQMMRESEDSVTKWAREADKYERKFERWETLFGDYKEWVDQHMHVKHEDLAGFKDKMQTGGHAEDGVRKVLGKSVRVAVIRDLGGDLVFNPMLAGRKDLGDDGATDNVVNL